MMLGTKAVAAYFGDALDNDRGFVTTMYPYFLNCFKKMVYLKHDKSVTI